MGSQETRPQPQPQPRRKIINGYQIRDYIGSGTYGGVYQAYKNNRVYAIKIQKPNNQIQQQQMVREAQLMRNYKSEYVVKLFQYFKQDNKIYLVMEKCEMDLEQRLKDPGISPNQRIKYCRQIIKGVSFLHANKIVHKDLKPQNFLIQNGNIKISDFGCAKKIERSLHEKVGGTHAYMAPQIFQGLSHTLAVDSYSMGIIMLIILSGKQLEYFGENGYVGCKKDFPKQQDLKLIEDLFFRQIVRSCLKRNHKERKSVTDIASQLEIKEMLERNSIIHAPSGVTQQESERYSFDDLINEQIRDYIDLSNS